MRCWKVVIPEEKRYGQTDVTCNVDRKECANERRRGRARSIAVSRSIP
jgi:hypothetical protein